MKELTTPTGFRYKLWDEAGSDSPIIYYLSGMDENINNSIFVSQFVPSIKDRFNIAIPYFVSGRSGWEWLINGEMAEVYFNKYFRSTISFDGRMFSTGWSAGGTYDPKAILLNNPSGPLLTGFVICAGSGDDYHGITSIINKVPVRHYHGDKDGFNTSTGKYSGPNNYELGKKTAISWYGLRDVNEDSPDNLWSGFWTIRGGNHSSAPQKAYNPSGDLANWLLSQGQSNPIPEPDIVLTEPFKVKDGTVSSVGSDGKTYKWSIIT